MDIQEQTTTQIPTLSPQEIRSMKTKLNQPNRTQKDWDFIKSLLQSRSLFTVCPGDENLRSRFTIDGVLYDQGVLLAFSDEEFCEEYGKRFAAIRIGREFTIVTVPYEQVLSIAADHEKDAYIDFRKEKDERFLEIGSASCRERVCTDV